MSFHSRAKTKYPTFVKCQPVTASSTNRRGGDYNIKTTFGQSLRQDFANILVRHDGTVCHVIPTLHRFNHFLNRMIVVQHSDCYHVWPVTVLNGYDHVAILLEYLNIIIESAPIKLFQRLEDDASDFQNYRTKSAERFEPLAHPQTTLLPRQRKKPREVLKQCPISIRSAQTNCIQQDENIRSGSCRGSDLHGKLKIGAWKLTAGRSKSWKSCPREKLPTRRQKQRGRHPSCSDQLPHHCQQSNTLSEPASLLERCASFRKARRSSTEQGQLQTRKKKKVDNNNHHLECWDYAQRECYMPSVRQAGKCSPSQQDTTRGDGTPHQETVQQSLTLLRKTATRTRRPETVRAVRGLCQDTFWEPRQQFRLQKEKALAHSSSPSSDKAKLTSDGPAAPVRNDAGRDDQEPPKRKDGRKRRRAIHKFKIPDFSSFNSARDFLTRRWVGLANDASELLALRVIGHDNGVRLLRVVEKKEKQLNSLSLKYEQAITRQRQIKALVDKMMLELREHDEWLNQWSARMVESAWMLRKKPLVTQGKELQLIGNPNLELCCYYGVSTLQDLFAWYDWQSMALVREINQP